MTTQYHTSPQSPLSPMSEVNEKRPYQYEEVVEEDRFNKAGALDQRMKRKIRRMRVVQRVLNLIISIIVLGIMVNTFVTFTNHRTTMSGGQTINLYPVNPITWPTYMMIATGAVSILFNSAIMTAYCWGVSAANRMNQYAGYWGYLMHVVNIGVWLATTTTFKMVQGGPSDNPPPRDIWGWTCSDAVDQLSAKITSPVNFDLQCKTQTVSFAVGIINVGLELFAIGINIYALRRMIYKKRMEQMQQHLDAGVPTVQ